MKDFLWSIMVAIAVVVGIASQFSVWYIPFYALALVVLGCWITYEHAHSYWEDRIYEIISAEARAQRILGNTDRAEILIHIRNRLLSKS